MKLRDLPLPRGLNLDVLRRFLSEGELERLIDEYAHKPHNERRIVLPSKSCLHKCLIYHLVVKHKGDFSAVIEELRGEATVLANDGHYITNIKRLYETRKREIIKEKRGERK